MTDAEYNRKYFSSFKLKKMKIPKAVKKVNKAIAKVAIREKRNIFLSEASG